MRLATLAAIALSIVPGAIHAAPDVILPARPSGVEESKWVSISETFGFVITKDVQTLGTRVDPGTGKRRKIYSKDGTKVSGYFVVRRGGMWCRVNIEPNEGGFLPLSMR